MSWFDASGFASLAKSALKEAQKTIDKALDIKEEEQKATENRMIDETNFFASFGLKNDSKTNNEQPISSTSTTKQDTSVWGSFTGSFFETQNAEIKLSKRSGSLDEKLENTISSNSLSQSISLPEKFIKNDNILQEIKTNNDNDLLNKLKNIYPTEKQLKLDNKLNEKQDDDGDDNKIINRVSIISTESDKKSSESVEILGSCSQTNTDCTTTPDSDIIVSEYNDSLSTSAIENKKNSESVEILSNSLLTSPSSVEVLEDDSKLESPFLSPIDDYKSHDIEPDSESYVSSSDISPYASPMVEEKSLIIEHINETKEEEEEESSSRKQLIKTNLSIDKNLNQNIDELDEISQAEDSYTSASESTVVMTIIESFNQQETILENPENQNVFNSTEINIVDTLNDVKQNLHLSLEPITKQPIQKNECLNDENFIKNSTTTIEPKDIDLHNINQVMFTDSSCEGTIIETSSDDNITYKQDSPNEQDTPLTSSSYVKNMLADAMDVDCERQDIDVTQRENSPVSLESRSDLVKIGSDHASGHTSGDELETTTTSSDIEIISSPNGDSSSTQSRQSPANLHSNKAGDLLTKALKTRGHSRELSEISIGSDAASHEIEKLLKRIHEMNEILEVRESKLIDVSRMNMELHEQNNNLKIQIDNWEKRGQKHQDLHLINDDYTQRMSALEKKFQQTIRERDLLKEQLELLKKEITSQSLIVNDEKDELIKQLRIEGEKLSKQQLQHSNIIKKLRNKEKDNDLIIKNQNEQIEEQNCELERLKRSLNAKDDVERNQIEAVHTLTAKVKKQDKEISLLQDKLTTTTEKMNVYKTSIDAAKVELIETKLNLNKTEKKLKQALDNAGESCELMSQVEDLKIKLRSSEEEHVKHVDLLKQENNDLLIRLESAEARNEELSQSITTTTKPLLRQLEQLQNNLSHKTNTYMKQEKIMTEKIDQLQAKLENTIATDRTIIEENLNLKTKLTKIESQFKKKELDLINIQNESCCLKKDNEKLLNKIKELEENIKILEESHRQEVKLLKREIESLGDKLSIEKAAIDAEKRKNHSVLDQQQQQHQQQLQQQQSIVDDPRISPTSSVRRDSISSTNSVWLAFNDSMFDTSSGRLPSVYDGLRNSGNTTSTIETLQAQLKSREGEIQMLQWEISRRNNERDALNIELSNLSMKVDELSIKLTKVEALNENLNEIQTRYDALLQMYGEKVEENEELRLDLEDVKEMYKSQIDQLLKRGAT
ncbi:hypothetical protein HCN44_008469 [Aphidius gifuensis]|uniref:TATA element modulatory factor 1 TATA binding domain-containing protein n=1 Tax=Aphidius gifuensis TaxID=684658 RepID=A0A835CR43_APHGI|nr:TATA element modulatory factor [Aphidius gifuensis]KAF7989795.1 hypothetical protein HCN44_008469 [Aphidius gifuensis]